MHMPHTHDHRREELSRSHRIFLNLSIGEEQITMSIHSGGVGISTLICE